MRALIVLAVLGTMATTTLSGCLFGAVDGIPCDADAACPSTYFCDLPAQECRETTNDFGVPAIRVKEFLDPRSSEPVSTPFVPPGETSRISLLPENFGKSPATRVGVTFAELECVQYSVVTASLPDEIAPGAKGRIDVDVTTGEGCDGLKIIDWFIVFSGRETRGTFDLNIKDL